MDIVHPTRGKLVAGIRIWLAGMLFVLTAIRVNAADQDLPNPLTLAESVSIALSNSSIIRTAQSRLDQASGRYVQSRSALLPQIDVFVNQTYLTMNLKGLGIDIPTVPQGKQGPFASMNARVRLSQDLLNIANRKAWKSSRSREESSRLQVTNARETVVLDVAPTYLQALRAKTTRDTLLDQKKLAGDLYKLTEDRVRHGVSAPLESNRAMQQVNSLEQQRQEADDSYVAAKLRLAELVQVQATSDFEVTDTAAYGSDTRVNRDAAVKEALASRPDYLAVQTSIRATEQQVSATKAYRLPVASASFSDGQSGESPVSNQNVLSAGGISGDSYLYRGAVSAGRLTRRKALCVKPRQMRIDCIPRSKQTCYRRLPVWSGLLRKLKQVLET